MGDKRAAGPLYSPFVPVAAPPIYPMGRSAFANVLAGTGASVPLLLATHYRTGSERQVLRAAKSSG